MSRELSIFNHDFNLLDPFFDDAFFRPYRKEKELLKTDVIENENDYEIVMDIPGLKKEDVNITLEDGYLTVNATKKSNENKEKKNYISRERYFYSASRSLYVGNITEDQVKAKLEDGELHISIPKIKEEAVTKKTISIE